MLTYIKKDIATVTRGVVAHGVNCQGVMGSGVAKCLRDKHPSIFTKYHELCEIYKRKNNAGYLLGIVDFATINSELIIANCFTQEYYGRTGAKFAKLEAVEESVHNALDLADALGLPFYMPKIGCGLGGLSWSTEVEPVMKTLSKQYGTAVFVCEQ